jgi:PAS domain S-box-containing protein
MNVRSRDGAGDTDGVFISTEVVRDGNRQMAGRHVLYLDDGRSELAEAALTERGLSVTVVRSLEAALATTDAAGVVVGEVPGGAADAVARLREHDPTLPVVRFAREGDERAAAEAFRAGATDYVGGDEAALPARLERALADADGETPGRDGREEGVHAGEDRRLRRLVDCLPGMLYRTRLEDGRAEVVAGAAEELTGRPPEAFDAGGVRPGELIHPDDRERVRRLVHAALENGEPFDVNYRLESPDGDRRVNDHGRGVPVEDPVAVEGFLVDIGEEDDEELQLRALHEETRRLVGAENPEEVAGMVTEATKRVLGYPLNGVRLYDPAQDVLRPATMTDETRDDLGDRPPYRVGAADESYPAYVFRTGESAVVDDVREDDRARAPGGSVRAAMYFRLGPHGVLSIGSGEPGVFGERDRRLAGVLAENARVALDRAARNADLRSERDRLAALFENIPEPTARVRFVDDEPVVETVNSAFEETFGYEPATMEGRSLDSFIVPSDGREEAAANNERTQAGERFVGEVTRLTADGPREFLLHVVPHTAGGESAMGYAIYTDISNRKRRERELKRQNERLEEFAGVVSHDLRNPLNIAEGRLELARETGDPDDFEAVSRAHTRMRRLIEDLLDLARQGRTLGELDTVSLEDSVGLAWGSVEGTEAELVCTELPRIRADRDRLSQLLVNLFTNANIHASGGTGGVTVTVGALPDGTGFYVADDGPGIPPKERETVFESGFSTDETGTGFGLAIVRSIAEAHDWTISVTESTDGGARFEFRGVTLGEPDEPESGGQTDRGSTTTH